MVEIAEWRDDIELDVEREYFLPPDIITKSEKLVSIMLSIAKNILRPTLTRTFAVPSGRAFKHTLPALPYAYDVSSISSSHVKNENQLTGPISGSRTLHI